MKWLIGKPEEVKRGMLLLTDLGTQIYLVGDVNESLGVCDDCMTFDESRIIAHADASAIINDLESGLRPLSDAAPDALPTSSV